MNIFILDLDHRKNAEFHADKHVVKMILESAQLLSSAVRLSGIDEGYRLTHKNHPCAKWVRESLDNWIWLVELTEALNEEWQYRYDHVKNHKSYELAMSLPLPEGLEYKGLTPFAQAMPDELKDKDPVVAYRNYYLANKRHLFGWKKREIPYWVV